MSEGVPFFICVLCLESSLVISCVAFVIYVFSIVYLYRSFWRIESEELNEQRRLINACDLMLYVIF